MMLSLMGYENSNNVPKGLDQRIQFLFFLGSPNGQGNVTAVDTRFMDPFRDTANYASLSGWLEGLNPVLLAPLSMSTPRSSTAPTSCTRTSATTSSTASRRRAPRGTSPPAWSSSSRSWAPWPPGDVPHQRREEGRPVAGLAGSDPNRFYKSIFEDLNIPFAQIQKINVKQIAVYDEIARYDVAENAAKNAFQTGNFSLLNGYSSCPIP